MNINRDYLIINDVKKSNVKLDNGSIFFYITDKNTQNIFVNLVINISNNELIQKYANIENAEDYTLTMNIVKPSNTYKVVEGKLHDKEKAIFEFNLNEDCCDEIGTYRCELLTKCNINGNEEITTSNKLTYKVKSSVLNDLDDIVEAPEYPLVIQLFDKLSDIEQYEEDRRTNELARQLAEEQRQTRFNALDNDMADSIQVMDDKVIEVENRISAKEQAVDKLIVDTKADIDNYKVAKDQEIDNYKASKDTEINNAITNQDNKIDTAINAQNDRITVVENNVVAQNSKLDVLEAKATTHEARITAVEAKNTEQDSRLDVAENRLANIGNDITNTMQPIIDEHTSRLDAIEAIDVSQNTRLDAIEVKNQQQDDRLLDIEKVNNKQDIDIKCLYGASQTIDVTKEGNSIYLQNSNNGFAIIDEIKGNTMVNCNKEPDKELILNGNINAQGYSNVTLTEGVDGGLVDIALEGNTMVNVCDQKDPVAITKSYTVETGNHVALQGEYDGKCRPVVTGNTLVNLARYNNSKPITTLTEYYDSYKISDTSLFKEGVEYTLIYTLEIDNSSNSSYTYMNLGLGTGHNMSEIIPNLEVPVVSNGMNLIKFTFANPNNRSALVLRPLRRNTEPVEGESVTYSYKDLVILEGDYTNKPIPEYFEGLQSSFEDKVVTQEMVDAGEELAENLGKYKVDYVVTGKNKFNPMVLKNCPIVSINGDDIIFNGTLNSHWWFEVSLPKGTYVPSGENSLSQIRLFYKGNDSGFLGVNSITYDSDVTLKGYIRSGTYDNVIASKLQIEEGDTATSYEPYKEYTKTLYLNSPLLEGDTIEQQGNNVVHVHRYGKVVLDNNYRKIHANGSNADELTNCYKFYFSAINNMKIYQTIICDKFLSVSYNGNNDFECLMVGGSRDINIRISKSKLSDYSVEALRTYLQSNPITVVYELVQPQYELIEQSNLVIPSYANGHLDFNTAVPIKKVEFKPFSEELAYLYPNTQYTVQFISTRAILVDYYLGGALLLSQNIVKGLNRISITTPSELVDNKLTINGNDTGANIMEVIVTDIDRELEYFEGMKSVGEGKELQVISINSERRLVNTQRLTHEPLRGTRDAKDRYVLIDGKWYIERKCGIRAYQEGDKDNYKTDLINTVYPLEMPTYEKIDYNPLEVYSGTTNITTNSVIPPNITVKNHGFNCLLKPSTTYTISSNLGLNTVTTPSTLTEDCLRFYDTDTSNVTTMRDVLILEGDWTTKADLIPANFNGIESAFEQEYDTEKGKYKVNVKVANEDKTKENNITFYINEPLRGIGNVKDRVYIKDDKVVVQRNCGIRPYEDGDFGTYPTDKVNTVYPLAAPTYEEVEYNDTKLFIESFKNSTLSYNSNVPVTSKLYYSYSVPIVDTVAQTANVTDQQDSMIIDLATQVAVMEMMLM